MSERRRQERRIGKRIEGMPTKMELRAVFHRLWTSQVGQPNYSKRDWQELQRILFRMFHVEV